MTWLQESKCRTLQLLETLRAFEMPSIFKKGLEESSTLYVHVRRSCMQVIPRVPRGRDLVLGLSSDQRNDTEANSLPT